MKPYRMPFAGGLITALLLSLSAQAQSSDPDINALTTEARSIVKTFAGQLKPQLISAMQNGGPVNAINVCANTAPSITRALSKETGWAIQRVSLKPRNSNTAVADSWQQTVLHQFEQQKATGTAVNKLEYSAINQGVFHYMKAQGVEPVCLNCHGSPLLPEVEKAIQQYYPNDTATGYSLGDIRGAFSLKKVLDQ